MNMPVLIVAVSLGLVVAPAFAQDASRGRPIQRDNVLKRAGAQFDRMDANKDGFLDAAEMNAVIEEAVAKLRARMQARFAEADTSKDGKITRDEFVAARNEWFAAVDTNGDGIIDQTELNTYNASRGSKAREGAKP